MSLLDGNSTYSILNVVIDFEHTFNRFASKEHLYDITLKFSGTSYVTLIFFFHEFIDLDDALNDLMDNSDNSMREMTLRMRAKFNKYWCLIEKVNKLLCIFVVLDLRHKFTFNQMYRRRRETTNKMIQSVRDGIEELLKFYSVKYVSTYSQSQSNSKVWCQFCLVSLMLVDNLEK